VSLPLRPGEAFNPYRMFTGVFIPEGLARCSSVSAGAKLAWGRLARYAGDDGHCFPTVKSLGGEIGASVRQTQRHLTELEANHLIQRLPRVSESGQTSNVYLFLWHSIFEGPVKQTAPGVTDTAPEGVTDVTPEGVTDVSPKESQSEESQFKELKET